MDFSGSILFARTIMNTRVKIWVVILTALYMEKFAGVEISAKGWY
jgi:hypothetical protein